MCHCTTVKCTFHYSEVLRPEMLGRPASCRDHVFGVAPIVQRLGEWIIFAFVHVLDRVKMPRTQRLRFGQTRLDGLISVHMDLCIGSTEVWKVGCRKVVCFRFVLSDWVGVVAPSGRVIPCDQL